LRRQRESCFLIDLVDSTRKVKGASSFVLRNQGAEFLSGRFEAGVAIGLAILEHVPDQHDELAGERGDGDVVASLAANAIEGRRDGRRASREDPGPDSP
jgi:hypothetical protein